jgi:hypothetical protein
MWTTGTRRAVFFNYLRRDVLLKKLKASLPKILLVLLIPVFTLMIQ